MTKLVLMSAKAAATTYSFVTEGDGFKSWALCTVNDQTGELLITSDWGSWSHRWHASPEALGAPTLTAFIGDRGDVDYLARKLQREGHGQQFSSDKTVHELKRLLCARRLEDGREQLENRLEPEDFDGGRVPKHYRTDLYTETGLPLLSHRTVPAPNYYERDRTERLPYLTAEKARELWDALESLADACGGSEDLFWERFPAISGFTDHVTEEPWAYRETEQTHEDKALRDIVLPALIAACKHPIPVCDELAAARVVVAATRRLITEEVGDEKVEAALAAYDKASKEVS